MPTASMQKGKIIAHHYLTNDTITVRIGLSAGSKFNFKAGQFIVLDVGPNQSRSYSICSAPSAQDYLEICVKLLAQGPGSSYLRGLKLGDEVSFRGPFGTFVLGENQTPNLLFVATGTGFAPIHAMLKTLAEQQSEQNILLLFGLRNEKSIFFPERLDLLKKQLHNFNYVLALSQPSRADHPYYTGRVTDYLAENYHLTAAWDVYLCGGQDMILDVRQLLNKHDFPQKNIFTESFY